MIYLFCFISLIFAFIFLTISLLGLTKGRLNALNAGLLGMGGLVLLDISKYYFIDAERVGDLSHQLFSATVLLIFYSTLLVLIFYYVGRSLFSPKYVARKIVFMERPSRLKLVGWLVLPMAFLASTFISNNDSAYTGLLIGVFRGCCLGLICYGIYFRNTKFVLVGVAAMLFVMLIYGESSRRSYIAIFIPILLAMANRLQFDKIKLGGRAKILVALIFIFVFLNAMRSGNDFGEGFNPDTPVKNTIHYITHLTSIDTFFNTAFIIENFPDRWDYYFGETYLSVLVAPIPRSMWPEKPVSLGAPLGMMKRLGIRDFDSDLWQDINMFSLSPSFVGEAYANGGFLFVSIVSILLGLTMGLYDGKLLCNVYDITTLKLQIFLSSFLMVHRGDFYVAINFQLAMFIGLLLFERLCFRRRVLR